MQLDALEARAHRRLEVHLEAGEVLEAHEAAFLLDEARHVARDVAFVERIARGLEPGFAAFAPRDLALFVGHELERAAEIRLHEDLARFRRPAFRQKHFAARRPALIRSRCCP